MAAMTTELIRLGAETWGERLRRARDRAQLNVREAAELISPYVPTSYATLARLERKSAVMATGRAAQIAFVALLVYGIDPADFGLADLPECRALNAESILQDLEYRRAPQRMVMMNCGPMWRQANRPTLALAA